MTWVRVQVDVRMTSNVGRDCVSARVSARAVWVRGCAHKVDAWRGAWDRIVWVPMPSHGSAAASSRPPTSTHQNCMCADAVMPSTPSSERHRTSIQARAP